MEKRKLSSVKRMTSNRIRIAGRTITILKTLIMYDGNARVRPYLNKVLYPLLSMSDLAFGLRDLLRSLDRGNVVECQYYARVVSVTICDIFDRVTNIVTKSDREFIEATMGATAFIRIKKAFVPLEQIKKIQAKDVQTIRHNTFAHRHKDAFSQVNVTDNIYYGNVYLVGEGVYEALTIAFHEMTLVLGDFKTSQE